MRRRAPSFTFGLTSTAGLARYSRYDALIKARKDLPCDAIFS